MSWRYKIRRDSVKEGIIIQEKNAEGSTVTGQGNEKKSLVFSYMKGPFLPSGNRFQAEMEAKILDGGFDAEVVKFVSGVEGYIQSGNRLVVIDIGISSGKSVAQDILIASIVVTPQLKKKEDPIRKALSGYLAEAFDADVKEWNSGGYHALLIMGILTGVNVKELRQKFQVFIENYESNPPA